MYKGKSNVEIVRSYLDGIRPFVTVGYTPSKHKRKEGDTWTDNKGIKWTQKNGYKVQINDQSEMIRKTIKQKCDCGQEIQYGDKLDTNFFKKTGKCFNCIIKEETELRVLGVYSYYENYKLLANYLGILEETKQKIEESIRYFETESDTLKVLCNSEGFLEKFKGINQEKLLETAKEDLKQIDETIEKININKNEAKRIYDTETIKAKCLLIKEQ